MKRIILTLILFGVLYAAGFTLGKTQSLRFVKESPVAEVLDLGFRPTRYSLVERPFVCVVIGCNNGAFVEKTLRSIFSQVYSHSRLVYVDDGSTDGSFSLVQDVVEGSSYKDRVTLIQNIESKGQLATLCEVVSECDDREIIVWIDGSDWLAHEWVLSSLNNYYANPDLWLTYGQYREFPDYRLGVSAPFHYAEWKEKGFRGHPFVASHLKTFYAGLFKCVDPADFTYQGAHLAVGTDFAVMIPLLELAQDHFQYVPEILYIANREAVVKEDQEAILRSHRYIRSLSSYEPLPQFVQSEAVCE